MRRIILYLFGVATGLLILEELRVNGWVVVGIAVGAWYWTLRRGLLTVRAFMYLGMLSAGISPVEANYRVFKVGYLAGSSVAPAAKSFVREYYGGKQLAMIAEARRQGFVG